MVNKDQAFVTLCKRLLILLLIENGVNGVMKISAATGISRRTIQESLKGLKCYKCEVEYLGNSRNGGYVVKSWGAIDRKWAIDNIDVMCEAVGIDAFEVSKETTGKREFPS